MSSPRRFKGRDAQSDDKSNVPGPGPDGIIVVMDPGKAFNCQDCGMGFSKKQSLFGHLKVHKKAPGHGDGGEQEKCPVCGTGGFKGQEEMKKHQRMHQSRKPWKCKICSFGFEKYVIMGREQRRLMDHIYYNEVSLPFQRESAPLPHRASTRFIGEASIPLRDLFKVLLQSRRPFPARDGSQRSQGSHLRRVREGILSCVEPEQAQAHSFWGQGETLCMHSMREKIRAGTAQLISGPL